MADELKSFLENFGDIVVSEDLTSVRHNPTDYSSFHKFQEELNLRFAHSEYEKARREIQSNLLKWDQMQTQRWRGATLSRIEGEAGQVAAHQIIELIKERGCSSLYIQGGSGSGKTYIAYATLRRYIGHGWVSPSQIKVVSEEFLVGLAEAGFEGRSRFEELFKLQYTVYLFDGVFSRPDLPPKVRQFWEQLIDHIYNRSLTVIFTSNVALEPASAFLSDSGRNKFDQLTSEGVIPIKSEDDALDAHTIIDEVVMPSRRRS